MVPAVSLLLPGGKSNAVATAMARAAVTPAPIATLPLVLLKKLFCWSVIINPFVCWTGRDARWTLVAIPGIGFRASPDSVAITIGRRKSWRHRPRRVGRNGILDMVKSTRPAGGSIAGISPRTANRRLNSLNSFLISGFSACRRSSVRRSSSDASPSRTAWISSM
jgi:hypothetical protein